MKEAERIFQVLRNVLVSITIAGGFVDWLFLPQEAAVHFDLFFAADRIGNKAELLPVLALPLFALIPYRMTEYHTAADESVIQSTKIKHAIYQFVSAVVLCALVWIMLIKA